MSATGPTTASGIRRVRPGIAQLFEEALWLGTIGFGGGYSVLAMIRNRVVDRRGWITEREFTNAATIGQMLPGGAAANTLAYIGLRFGGQAGAAACYVGFSLPGFLACLALAWAYVHYGTTPHVDRLLGGLNAAVVGIIVGITVRMVRTGVQRPWQMGVASLAMLLAIVGGGAPLELVLLGIASGLVIDQLLKRARARSLAAGGRARKSEPVALPDEGHPLPAPPKETPPPTTLRELASPIVLATIFATFLHSPLVKLGALFFRTGLGAYGGGFAIIPHLQRVLIENHWLDARQFADAVAIAKLTPGPILLMATFIGYVVGGLPAALIATLAIFAGPYVLVVVLGSWLTRVRSRRPVRAALRGLTPAVVGLMAASAITLGDSLRGSAEYGIAAAVALTLVRFEMNPAILLAIAGVARLVLGYYGM